MKTQQYLQSEKYSKLIFIACFAAYSSSYIGRINFSAALPAIINDGFFTKTEAGIIGSAFFIVYGAFQIINGFLGDKITENFPIAGYTKEKTKGRNRLWKRFTI